MLAIDKATPEVYTADTRFAPLFGQFSLAQPAEITFRRSLTNIPSFHGLFVLASPGLRNTRIFQPSHIIRSRATARAHRPF
jgi:hypothetical protein